MFNPIFEKFGVVKVEGTRIKIFRDNFNHEVISCNAPVSHAMWTGGTLTVYLLNGEIRRYTNYWNFQNVR